MTDMRENVPCDGSLCCYAKTHIHGCFSDRGRCDHPEEHRV